MGLYSQHAAQEIIAARVCVVTRLGRLQTSQGTQGNLGRDRPREAHRQRRRPRHRDTRTSAAALVHRQQAPETRPQTSTQETQRQSGWHLTPPPAGLREGPARPRGKGTPTGSTAGRGAARRPAPPLQAAPGPPLLGEARGRPQGGLQRRLPATRRSGRQDAQQRRRT